MHIGQRSVEVGEMRSTVLRLPVFLWEEELLEDFCLNFLNFEIEKLEMINHYQKEKDG